MENLPLEITENILSSLPMALKLQCRGVCTTWRTLVPKPKKGLLYEISHLKGTHETEAQIYFSELNNDKVSTKHVDGDEQLSYLGTLTKLGRGLIKPSSSDLKSCIAGSCHGLVCYGDYDSFRRIIYILNPVTGEQIQLPITDDVVFDIEKAIGFGYNCSSNEYKVVRLVYNISCREQTVQVYTLQGGTGWRKTSSIIREQVFSQLRYWVSAGVFADGALHWIDEYSIEPKIVAFDLKNETFKLLPSIPFVGCGTKQVGLMELGGNLCVLELAPRKPITIWEWSTEYAQKHRKYTSAWIAKFRLAWEDYCYALRKSDQFLLWHNAVLSSYDPETKTLRKLDENLRKLMDDGTPYVCTTTRATPHINSLVSLKAILEGGCGKAKLRKSS